MSYMMAQKIGEQGEKTLLCLTIFLLNAEPFFPLVAPTCQKAGEANNGEFFKGKANVTCEYHVKNFRIVLFSLFGQLETCSTTLRCQHKLPNLYWHEWTCCMWGKIQEMLEDCKTAVAMRMWGRGEIFLLDPWECGSGRNIPYMQLWKAGTADIWRDALSLCFLCLEPWPSANYMNLCTCWLCHAVFAAWGWFLDATERASRHMRKRS